LAFRRRSLGSPKRLFSIHDPRCSEAFFPTLFLLPLPARTSPGCVTLREPGQSWFGLCLSSPSFLDWRLAEPGRGAPRLLLPGPKTILQGRPPVHVAFVPPPLFTSVGARDFVRAFSWSSCVSRLRPPQFAYLLWSRTGLGGLGSVGSVLHSYFPLPLTSYVRRLSLATPKDCGEVVRRELNEGSFFRSTANDFFSPLLLFRLIYCFSPSAFFEFKMSLILDLRTAELFLIRPRL